MKRYLNFCFAVFFLTLIVFIPKSLLADTEYYRSLLKKDTAHFIDGCRAIFIVKTNNSEFIEYKSLINILEKSGIVPKKWKYNPERSLTWDTMSYMICKALDIKGGWVMRAFGTTKRYAYRECMFMDLIPFQIQNRKRILSGIDLLSVMSRLERYKIVKSVNR